MGKNQSRGTRVGISSVALERTRVINLPKLKAHRQLGADNSGQEYVRLRQRQGQRLSGIFGEAMMSGDSANSSSVFTTPYHLFLTSLTA